MISDDSLTMINFITIDHEVVGINSRLTNEYQMSDPNLRWIRNIIISKSSSGNKFKVPKKNLDTIQKKFLKQLPNLKIWLFFGSFKDSSTGYYGYGRSIAIDKRRA